MPASPPRPLRPLWMPTPANNRSAPPAAPPLHASVVVVAFCFPNCTYTKGSLNLSTSEHLGLLGEKHCRSAAPSIKASLIVAVRMVSFGGRFALRLPLMGPALSRPFPHTTPRSKHGP